MGAVEGRNAEGFNVSPPPLPPSTAPKLVMVGEAFGDEERRQGLPFVGPAGKLLEGLLAEVGLGRNEVYLTNLLMDQPNPTAPTAILRNDFKALYTLDRAQRIPGDRLRGGIESVRTTLTTLQSNVIVALGGEPLYWLTGRTGIGEWRGSVLPLSTPLPQGPRKVIPTYHPAAILRQWAWRPLVIADLKRALQEAAFPDCRQTLRTLHLFLPEPLPFPYKALEGPRIDDLYRVAIHVHRGLDSALEALTELRKASPIAFDIETERLQPNTIAFAPNSQEGCVFPFFWGEYGSLWAPRDEALLWGEIQTLFHTTPVMGQNVSYDLTFLSEIGVWPAHLYLDTMVAFHTLYPELPMGLEFLCSLYTDLPYYKGLGKVANPYTHWIYNGLDAVVTWECAQLIEAELKE